MSGAGISSPCRRSSATAPSTTNDTSAAITTNAAPDDSDDTSTATRYDPSAMHPICAPSTMPKMRANTSVGATRWIVTAAVITSSASPAPSSANAMLADQ